MIVAESGGKHKKGDDKPSPASDIYRYILFDVVIINTKPNKENQRLLSSFGIVPIALMIIK